MRPTTSGRSVAPDSCLGTRGALSLPLSSSKFSHSLIDSGQWLVPSSSKVSKLLELLLEFILRDLDLIPYSTFRRRRVIRAREPYSTSPTQQDLCRRNAYQITAISAASSASAITSCFRRAVRGAPRTRQQLPSTLMALEREIKRAELLLLVRGNSCWLSLVLRLLLRTHISELVFCMRTAAESAKPAPERSSFQPRRDLR